ncbi:DUF4238 domain-containing protein [Chryseobacterium indoltheticum]|uniref:DUF4238 domain-containing protein n=1 Tax=Chryseobacterium indoltheticum TaxID=254 RepID=UPI0019124653|nr:DUF4238 domain-containing protein [Chryseobacterium indoltheticum]QQQ28948.1 DUF4238 domain-containing protein [Chryseobacterium indoltheticum]
MVGKDLTRNNHYVPQWYQKGFAIDSSHLHYLDLRPEQKILPNGTTIKFNERKLLPFSKCFFEFDLYTTFFGPLTSDIIERELFGKIDDEGSRAVRAFIDGSESERHLRFQDFFKYVDTQKSRTPKGLSWLRKKYSHLDQTQLMIEMEAVQQINITIWYEAVREIVSAENSNIKFIVSDHPVTTYNYACPPESDQCSYPNDPSIALKSSQTIFPLDKDHCLILTNYEYAEKPDLADPLSKRTNARHFGETMVRTNAFIRNRKLNDRQVQEINFVIKQRARRFIGAAQKDWLYPESDLTINWESAKQTLLPPSDEVFEFGGEMFAGYADGSTYSQDAFGRTVEDSSFFNKELPKGEPHLNDICPCGQGKSYKDCCSGKPEPKRPAWNILSIRERNQIFYNGINDIIGLSRGKDWDDVRSELNDQQIKDIHLLFEYLWPPHTDIINLLPKADGELRAIYTGVVDWNIIPIFATTAALYFDQLIIYNPFTHPTGINPKYSPVENPSIHKQQTLKNLAIFIDIFPLIDSGRINLIPDLGIFNKHLQFQIIDMSRQRHNNDLKINENEYGLLKKLVMDDYQRAMWELSEEQQKKQIRSSFPKANEEYISEVYEYSQKKRYEDPLALLQDNVLGTGGQLTKVSMSPNFEVTLLIAQLTGGIIFTDSTTRWNEILKAQVKNESGVVIEWSELIDFVKNAEFPFNIDIETVMMLDRKGKLKKMRQVWESIYKVVQSTDRVNIKEITEKLKLQIFNAIDEAFKDLSQIATSDSKEESEALTFKAKFDFIIPAGGIQDNNVLRLLVSSGADDYLKNVPIAIFASQANNKWF